MRANRQERRHQPGDWPWSLRIAVVAAALAALAALGTYAFERGPSFGVYYHDCVRCPGLCEGRETMLPAAPVLKVGRGRFELDSKVGPATVFGDPKGLKPGVYVDARGVFRPDGSLELTAIHIHEKRGLKIWMSLLALAAAGFLFLRDVAAPLFRRDAGA